MWVPQSPRRENPESRHGSIAAGNEPRQEAPGASDSPLTRMIVEISVDGLNILVLCEGDAETPDSWSGTSNSVVRHLRRAGHNVVCGDVDLYGLPRTLGLVGTFSPHRFRWWARYHLNRLPATLRSREASAAIRSHSGWTDLILQFGATFAPLDRGTTPYVLYCDSNARFAEGGETQGTSEVGVLSERERRALIARETRIYRDARRILTFSDLLSRSFRRDFGLPADQVVTVHAGANLDLDLIPPRPNDTAQDPPTVLFVGRAFERKGGDLLLRAWVRVRSEVPDARLVIIGPPPLRVGVEGVEELGFLNKADPSQRDRLIQAYLATDVFCLPTRYEPFGVSYVEAMHFGVPCVGPDAWAVPEIIDHGVTGLCVNPEDEGDLARALIRLLRDRSLAQRMGEAGRRRAAERFSWDAVVRRMVEAADVAGGTARGPGGDPRL